MQIPTNTNARRLGRALVLDPERLNVVSPTRRCWDYSWTGAQVKYQRPAVRPGVGLSLVT